MKVFEVSRKDYVDWDEYNSFICVAENEIDAKCMHPEKVFKYNLEYERWESNVDNYEEKSNISHRAQSTWVKSLNDVEVKEVDLTKPSILLTSFHAG